ncbi:WYL domain-containing protein [Saxibacter everestensis]|uniref:WYL domain-containing protein n=1 Tax=Saxibacter everestensis TaxID=2909229 RepID=A0ABY8QX71_9MICO|nr:WYL domain-containing protein [Brevibacteriaceae bacterium ZFBP1038]
MAVVPAPDHLSRLLAMVPYLLDHQGVALSETAKHFGISEDDVVSDLELLFVCGTPGHMPDDLIEADWESGQVFLGNAEELAKPVRLSFDEALSLIVGLRTLADVAGLHDRESLDSALAKLTEATGDSSAAARSVRVDLDSAGAENVIADLRRALSTSRRVHIKYLVPQRDEVTERDVDPMRLLTSDGQWYLEGWCHRAEDVRLFRTDRISDIEVLNVAGTPPASARSRNLDKGIFAPSETDIEVTLELDPQSAWIAEYYPIQTSRDLPEGRLEVTLRTADTAWLGPLLLREGGSARVVNPPGINLDAAQVARAALTRYAQTLG